MGIMTQGKFYQTMPLIQRTIESNGKTNLLTSDNIGKMTTILYNFNIHDLYGHFYGVTLILFTGRGKKVPMFKVGILKKLPCRPLTVGIIPPLNWIPSGRQPEIPPSILIASTYTRTKKSMSPLLFYGHFEIFGLLLFAGRFEYLANNFSLIT